MARRRTELEGVLIVDKARGPTSHDVVARARKALGTREVGHAGTLDPMATGVLVLAVGEGTKLLRWLTSDDKAYCAVVALGAETDTLDAEGVVTEEVPAEGIDLARAREASRGFLGRHMQVPPAYSAIKVDGEALHAKARRGEHVEVPAREVEVRRLDVLEADDRSLTLEVEAAKGFYVRALGRDLARALGTRGHLTALRRTRSGSFGLDEAVPASLLEEAASGDDTARATLRASLIPLAAACRAMPRVTADARGLEDAHHGRPVALPEGADLSADAEPVALLDAEGRLVAMAARRGDRLHVLRGLRRGA